MTKDQLTVADYEEVLADHRRLVRELDVLLNGEHGAAKQASLCDIVGQLKYQRGAPSSNPSAGLQSLSIEPRGVGYAVIACFYSLGEAESYRDGLSRRAVETTAAQAPIAWVVVADNGGISSSGSYAPGLPPGQHDLYCVPEALAPMMRAEETAAKSGPMPDWARLLLECRDALPAISLASAKLHNIDLTLADRIEAMLEPWKVVEKAAACPCGAFEMDGQVLHADGCVNGK